MYFEWDKKKAITNQRKRGASFEEAASALRDSFSATARDPDHSENEERFVTFGISSNGAYLRYLTRKELMQLASYRHE